MLSKRSPSGGGNVLSSILLTRSLMMESGSSHRQKRALTASLARPTQSTAGSSNVERSFSEIVETRRCDSSSRTCSSVFCWNIYWFKALSTNYFDIHHSQESHLKRSNRFDQKLFQTYWSPSCVLTLSLCPKFMNSKVINGVIAFFSRNLKIRAHKI